MYVENSIGAFDAKKLWEIRSNGYSDLGWVKNGGLQEKMLEVCNVGSESVVLDVGTGSGEIAGLMSPFARAVLAFDYSREMLNQAEGHFSSENIFVVQGSADRLFVPSESIDVVTARMVYHHLTDEQIAKSVGESLRVLKGGGRLVINEYVATDDVVLNFERDVFEIKESGRHLWTGKRLGQMISELSGREVKIGWAVLPKYSVKNWMGKSGLSEEIQRAVLNLYLSASAEVVDKMGIVYTEDGDALVDRPFVYVYLEK